MPTSDIHAWARRVLYRTLLLVALALALLVVASPFVAAPLDQPLLARLWRLFGQDATLRQTAVLGAIGLWTTAVVFFSRSRTTGA
jgi:hypothetical protein